MEILSTILPILLVILTGSILGASRFVPAGTTAAISRFVFFVAAPALLLRSAARVPLATSIDGGALLVTAAATVVMATAAYLCCARSAPARRGVLAQGAYRSNMVFVGLPVVQFAYGDQALAAAAVLIGFMVVVYNFVSVLVLVLPHNRQARGQWRRPLGAAALEVARNPLILGSGAGLAISALGWTVPLGVDRALELLGRTAMPLALLTVGAGMAPARLHSEWSPAALLSALKLIVYPGLIYGGLLLLGRRGTALAIPVIIMSAPTAVVSAIMAREMRGDEQLASAIIIGTSLTALFTLSGWLWLLPAH